MHGITLCACLERAGFSWQGKNRAHAVLCLLCAGLGGGDHGRVWVLYSLSLQA